MYFVMHVHLLVY